MHFSAQEYQPKGYLGSICAKEHPGQRALLMLHGAENVEVAAAQSKMLPVLVLGEGPWRVRQVRASVVERVPTA